MSLRKRIVLILAIVLALMIVSTIVGVTAVTSGESGHSSAGYAAPVMIGILVLAAIISLVFILRTNSSFFAPLQTLDEWLNLTANGDIVFKPDELAVFDEFGAQKDEIGGLFRAYKGIIDCMNGICDDLNKIADGRLDFEINPRSEYDLFMNSLKKMVESLEDLIGGLKVAADQVSMGSHQISEGASSLAQGSTEQAATIEELSASTNEIADRIKVDALMAGKAAELADSIKQDAEKGNHQMSDMISAVDEINQASQDIGKVMQVIDSIAFQTNILALNAAVEAARAGQHGKGFSVVAEEVRNLAAKSAEAAKDTGKLIANSMEKAQLGARIASETAASLAEIVSGINESSRIVGDIARSSETQSNEISQIHSGIDQVASVVQHNSATAEESAAASAVMNEQSKTLSELITRFKLKAHRSY